jgi:acid phosphatase type 7
LGNMIKRKSWRLVVIGIALVAAPTAWVLAEPSRRAPDPFGVIVPGLNAVVGPGAVLHGRAPGPAQTAVTIRVYSRPGTSTPVVSRTAHLAASFWSLPVKLGPGSYNLVVQEPQAHGKPLSWTRAFSVSEFPVIAAAGDIACDPASKSFHGGAGSPSGRNCQERATSDLMVGANLAAVLTIGDEQYENAQPSAFARSFGPTWGRLKGLIHPATGNHEYQPPNPAAAYFNYFDGQGRQRGVGGGRGQGWYSFDIGGWHLIALNSNCTFIGGCALGSPELNWLQTDLRSHPARCTLAYWHHPRFSSGKHGDDTAMTPIWQALQADGADVVLVGHDHDYERFAPQSASGQRDYVHGIREFVVGTGGKSHDAFRGVQPNSQQRNAVTFGVLELVLRPAGYDWRFVPVAGKRYSDAGTSPCH